MTAPRARRAAPGTAFRPAAHGCVFAVRRTGRVCVDAADPV